MTELVENDHGIEYTQIDIAKIRIHRTNGKWMVEYQRQPRWIFGIDRWWWFDDGIYVEYADACLRVLYLRATKHVRKVQFQTVKEFYL